MSDYTDLATLRAYLTVPVTAGTESDAIYSMAITAASTAIDRATNRTFTAQDSSATLRYFTPRRMRDEQRFLLPNQTFGFWWPFLVNELVPDRMVPIDDLFLTNQIITDLVIKDHLTQVAIPIDRLWPFNAAAKGKPYTAMLFLPSTALPDGEGAIDVTAKWGWPTIPPTIVNATLIQAARYVKRRDSPFGVAGSNAMTGDYMRLLPRLDPDVQTMVMDFTRNWAAV